MLVRWLLHGRYRFAEMLSKTEWANKDRRYMLNQEQEYVGALKAALGIW